MGRLFGVRRFLVFQVIFLGTLSAVFSQPQTVQIAAFEYPPFHSQTLPGQGISFQMAARIFQSQGITVVPEILPMARSYALLHQGSVPAAFGNTQGMTEEQKKGLIEIPIVAVRLVLLYNTENAGGPGSWGYGLGGRRYQLSIHLERISSGLRAE